MSSVQFDSSTLLERQSLAAAIKEAGAEVMKAQRLLDAAVDVHRAARSLSTWTAILHSRIARLKSIESRYRSPRLPTRFGTLAPVQHTCTEPGCFLRVAASTVEWSGRCPHGRQPIGPACATRDQQHL
jgi:hypothetical protein